jgi:predicted MFS family arabinose efflux permease
MTSAAARPTAARRAAFGAILALTMAGSTFAFTTFSVLSTPLLRTFDIDRWQLGALVTASSVLGAVLSPPMGRVADRIGGRNSLLMTLALSAASLAAIAVSPVYLLIVGGALAAGAAQAGANPATNKLIGMHGDPGSRGTLTGIKQAGVQVGVFLGGALLPLGATTIGWRRTLLATAALPLLGLLAARRVVPADLADDAGDHAGADPTDGTVRSPFLLRLATYGFLLGAGWSAVFTYLPDYGQHALGWSPTVAGLLVSAAGFCGIVGRIGWSRLAEHRLGSPTTLLVIATISVGAVGAVLASQTVPGLLWLGAAAFGGSAGSWNAVGMFAIIERLPQRAAGGASGIVMFGFLTGLGLGAPAFGWSVDVTGAYTVGLVAAAVVHGLGVMLALALRRGDVGALA